MEENFWSNLSRAQAVNQELKSKEDKLNEYESALQKCTELMELAELIKAEEEEDLLPDLLRETLCLEETVEEMRIASLLKGKYDAANAILTLHAGAGGTEAQDWVSMLYRMYTMYAEKNKYAIQVIDELAGDEAGIKSVTFLVSGENAYGYLKAEKGVHRLVRISPFDANSRRHTSFASLDVMPEIVNDVDIKIEDKDLKIDTYRSGGAGGQHVNKTESAIRITHLPTGIVVQCQNERSQIQNREIAMRMLKGKLVEKQEREQMEKLSNIQGELKKIEWGSQIRSYVFHPYNLVKDHRTGYETANIQAVMNGDIQGFINEYLKKA